VRVGRRVGPRPEPESVRRTRPATVADGSRSRVAACDPGGVSKGKARQHGVVAAAQATLGALRGGTAAEGSGCRLGQREQGWSNRTEAGACEPAGIDPEAGGRRWEQRAGMRVRGWPLAVGVVSPEGVSGGPACLGRCLGG
jgi:hypothetical protein